MLLVKKVLSFSPNGGMAKKNAHIFFKQVSSDVYRNVNTGKYVDVEMIIHSLKKQTK